MYEAHLTHSPSKQIPIPQSYLDTILHGCLSISPKFAEAWLSTTLWHNGEWINDRGACRIYKNDEVICCKSVEKIEEILKAVLPKKVIEGRKELIRKLSTNAIPEN